MRVPALLFAGGVLLALLSVGSIQRYAPCATGQPCPTASVDLFWLGLGVVLVAAGLVGAVVDRRSRDISAAD